MARGTSGTDAVPEGAGGVGDLGQDRGGRLILTISEQDDLRTGDFVLRMGDSAGDRFGEELGESESDEMTSGVLGQF